MSTYHIEFSLIPVELKNMYHKKCLPKILTNAVHSISLFDILLIMRSVPPFFWAFSVTWAIYTISSLISEHDYLYVQWTFHPFIYHSKRFYTVLIWRRVLAFLVVSMVFLVFVYMFHMFALKSLLPFMFFFNLGFTIFKDYYILFDPAPRSKLSLSWGNIFIWYYALFWIAACEHMSLCHIWSHIALSL